MIYTELLASRAAKRIKTWDLRKLENIKELLKNLQNKSLVPSLLAKIKTLLIPVKDS